MKKWFVCILAMLMMSALVLTVAAAGTQISVSDVEIKEDETIYVVVSLDSAVSANALGISYTWDKDILKPIPSLCTWELDGLMADFDRKGGIGVWAASDAVDMEGTVCVLAFELQEGAQFTDTDVECTLTVKKDGANVGEYTATGTVSTSCEHTYGGWKNVGLVGHSRTCSKCGDNVTQSHTWDGGAKQPGGGNDTVVVYTCTVCQGTKEEVLEGMNQDNIQLPENTEATLPLKPEDTPQPGPESTAPETEMTPFEPAGKPEEEKNGTQNNTQNGNTGTQSSNQSGTNSQSGTNNQNSSDHSHDHTHDSVQQEKPGAVEYDEEDLQSGLIIVDKNDQVIIQTPQTQPDEEQGETECTDPAHNHAHDHEGEEEVTTSNPALTAVAVGLTAAVILAVAVILLKKKR